MSRPIIYKTLGHSHGPITRLMSPSDLGQHLKPFVFLDLFNLDETFLNATTAGGGMPIHPHSGIATVTVLTNGSLLYDDPSMGAGTITYGGVEWMQAGSGVWHGKEMFPAPKVSRVEGFQLWLALPPSLENSEPVSRYIQAQDMKRVGPAHVIIGTHEGVSSPVPAPQGIQYLLVTLRAGETWTYQPPEDHTVGWLALAAGELHHAGQSIAAGEMVVFEQSEHAITLQSSAHKNSTFVVGSAIPHRHDLHLGHYSVHTSQEALAAGEQRIAELKQELDSIGNRKTSTGTIPVFNKKSTPLAQETPPKHTPQ